MPKAIIFVPWDMPPIICWKGGGEEADCGSLVPSPQAKLSATRPIISINLTHHTLACRNALAIAQLREVDIPEPGYNLQVSRSCQTYTVEELILVMAVNQMCYDLYLYSTHIPAP